jgi:ketosteroid isomerase-like protein
MQFASQESRTVWEKEIAAIEEEANRAFVERNYEALERLWADDMLVNSPINRINDKAKIVELLKKGVIGHVLCEIEPELVRRDGDVVIVMGADRVQDRTDTPMVNRRYTNVWRKDASGWRLYVRHANIVAEDANRPSRRSA